MRSVRSIVSGNDAQVDTVLEAGFLNHMEKLLNDRSSKIVETALFTISNVTAGNAQQIQAVIDAGIFEHIRNVMVHAHGDICTQREAAYVIANTTESGTPEQIRYLFQRVGILKPFCNLIHLNDDQLRLVVKDGLFDFLKIAGTDIFTDPIGENCVSDLSINIKDLKLASW